MPKPRTVSIVLPTLVALPLALLALGLAWPQAAPKVDASRLAGIQGAGITGMQCQNLDANQAMTLVVDFYNQAGGAPAAIIRPAVPAGFAANLYLPNEPSLRNGAYAAIASADRAHDCLSRTDWTTSGGSIMANSSLPGTEIIVPGVVKGYQNRSSLVSIQNTDTGAQATVQLAYHTDSPFPIVVTTIVVGPGTSTTIDLGKHPDFAVVPPGSLGFMRIQSTSPVAVNHIVDVENSAKGVYAFEGVPVEAAASQLYAPAIRSAASADGSGRQGTLSSTEWHLVNPGSASVQVELVFGGVAGGCAGQTYRQGPFVIPAGRSALAGQLPGADLPVVGVSPLPAGCTATGSVEVVGGELIGAVVEVSEGSASASAYTSFTRAGGGSPVYLPLYRKSHTAARFSTAVQVMNLGDQPTRASMTLWDSNGRSYACGACAVDLNPGEGHLFWPEDLSDYPDNMYGSARIDAAQPLAVVVTEVSATGASDRVAYSGLPRPGSARPPVPYTSFSPILITESRSTTTTSTPPPYPPPASPTPVGTALPGTATPLPTPVGTPATATPAIPTQVPPTAPPTTVPTATAPPFNVSDEARRGVPAAVLAAALQNPASINGWNQPRNPNQPPGPFNPPRTCLTLLDPGKAWHPLFNPLVFKAGCP